MIDEADDIEAASIFRIKLDKLIEYEHSSYFQVHNGDETGCFRRAMPRNSQMRKSEASVSGNKLRF